MADIEANPQPGIPRYKIDQLKGKSSDYCVLVVVLNEGDRIRNQLRQMHSLNIMSNFDLIILDGGSVDGSLDLNFLEQLQVSAKLTLIDQGRQGTQFRMGFDYALKRNYLGIITIDGNNKDDSSFIPAFKDKLSSGYDFIQGSRFLPGGEHINTPLVRELAVKLIHSPWISLLSRFHFTDTTNGFRGISPKYLKSKELNIFRKIFVGYELLFYMSVKAPKLGMKVCEIPVRRSYPETSVPSKIKGIRGYFGIIQVLLKLTFKKYDPPRTTK